MTVNVTVTPVNVTLSVIVTLTGLTVTVNVTVTGKRGWLMHFQPCTT